jgi:hypothetical protein
MKAGIKSIFAVLVAVAMVSIAPAAKAASGGPTVLFLGAGSSAMFQQFEISAVNDPTLSGANSHHYSIKGKCSGGVNCAQAFDNRTGPGGTVSDHQGGNLWVVWDNAVTQIWVYLSVDSVVGNRLFFAQPRATLQVSADTLNAGTAQNLVSPKLLRYGEMTNDPGCGGLSTCDDTQLPMAVYTAINNATLTAGMTDIRPEDALFATGRVLCPPPANGTTCLGYGPGPVGTSIVGDFSSSVATPVIYAFSGTDPVTGNSIPAWNTYPVGAQPITLVINKLPGGITATNVTHAQLQLQFSGTRCNELGVTTYTLLREPLSGTMNTFEFTNMTDPTFTNNFSQELGVTTNPLFQSCTVGGTRMRGIGTGDIVTGMVNLTTASGQGNQGTPVNAVGYLFFSYGNVSKLTNGANYGYLTLDSVDPLFGNPGYSAGTLPTCALPCPAAPNTTFRNLRNGSYRSWSMLRAVTDATGANNTNTAALVTSAQNAINLYVPDFVPFVAAGGDAGMQFYRSHFMQSGVAPNNGLPFSEPSAEMGGDAGGCIESKSINVTGLHENTGQCSR